MNLIDALKDQVTAQLAGKAASFLGETESGISGALDGIFPTLLSKVVGMSESSDGLDKIFKMASSADPDILDNVGDLFGSTKSVTNLMNGGSGILSALLGDNIGSIIETIAKVSGLKSGSSSSLLKMAAPFLMSMVGRYIKDKALDAVGLGKFLGTQKQSSFGLLPEGIGGLLGLGGLADMGKKVVDGAVDLAEDAVDAGKKAVDGAADLAGDAVETGAKAGGSILKWLLPLFLIALLASYFGFRTGCSAVDNTVDTTKDGIEVVGDAAGTVAKGVGDAAGAVAEGVGDAAGAVADGIGSLFSNINAAAKAALDKITFTAGSVGDQIMKYINGGFKGSGKFRFNNLTFNTGSASITADTAVEVDNLAAILKAYPDVKINISGYTDNTGDAAKNVELSKARAASVKARLMGIGGISGDRITTAGYGAANPVADNGTPEGRAQNRRIEVTLTK